MPFEPLDSLSAKCPFLSSVTVGYLELKKSKLSHRSLGCQLAGTAFECTTLLCLREVLDLRSTITQVIALGE
jgi:hypothetical protein